MGRGQRYRASALEAKKAGPGQTLLASGEIRQIWGPSLTSLKLGPQENQRSLPFHFLSITVSIRSKTTPGSLITTERTQDQGLVWGETRLELDRKLKWAVNNS